MISQVSLTLKMDPNKLAHLMSLHLSAAQDQHLVMNEDGRNSSLPQHLPPPASQQVMNNGADSQQSLSQLNGSVPPQVSIGSQPVPVPHVRGQLAIHNQAIYSQFVLPYQRVFPPLIGVRPDGHSVVERMDRLPPPNTPAMFLQGGTGAPVDPVGGRPETVVNPYALYHPERQPPGQRNARGRGAAPRAPPKPRNPRIKKEWAEIAVQTAPLPIYLRVPRPPMTELENCRYWNDMTQNHTFTEDGRLITSARDEHGIVRPIIFESDDVFSMIEAACIENPRAGVNCYVRAISHLEKLNKEVAECDNNGNLTNEARHVYTMWKIIELSGYLKLNGVFQAPHPFPNPLANIQSNDVSAFKDFQNPVPAQVSTQNIPHTSNGIQIGDGLNLTHESQPNFQMQSHLSESNGSRIQDSFQSFLKQNSAHSASAVTPNLDICQPVSAIQNTNPPALTSQPDIQRGQLTSDEISRQQMYQDTAARANGYEHRHPPHLQGLTSLASVYGIHAIPPITATAHIAKPQDASSVISQVPPPHEMKGLEASATMPGLNQMEKTDRGRSPPMEEGSSSKKMKHT